MASQKRRFRAFQAVGITERFVLRLPILEQPALRELLASLIARYAIRCQVQVLCYEVRPNHLHLTLAQRFDGHDRRRVRGISPFMRNLMSVLVKHANEVYATKGRLTERPFRSWSIATNERLLANQAYTLANAMPNTGAHPGASTHSAWAATTETQADGVVTHLPRYIRQLPDLAGIFLAIAHRAIADARRHGKRGAWLRATCEVIADHVPEFDGAAAPEFIDIAELVGRRQQARALELRLAVVMPRARFKPRRAPTLQLFRQLVGQSASSGPD